MQFSAVRKHSPAGPFNHRRSQEGIQSAPPRLANLVRAWCVPHPGFPRCRRLCRTRKRPILRFRRLCCAPIKTYGDTSKFAGKVTGKLATTVEVSSTRQGQSSQQRLRCLRLQRFQICKVCGIAHRPSIRTQQQNGSHRNHTAAH